MELKILSNYEYMYAVSNSFKKSMLDFAPEESPQFSHKY